LCDLVPSKVVKTVILSIDVKYNFDIKSFEMKYMLVTVLTAG